MAQHPHGSSDRDLAALAHLRGYPEELRRFSNLMAAASGFPRPLSGDGRHQVWRRVHVLALRGGGDTGAQPARP